jgi:hypothetical protein
MTVADDPDLRAERRAFIRGHHPDRGGDPDEFIEGLHRLADSPKDPSVPVYAYRSRRMTPTRWLRRMRARWAGIPPRRLK